MLYRPKHLLLGLGVTLALSMSTRGMAAQSCTLEYHRADNMFAYWGNADGYLGSETITLQPGEKKIFNTEWVNEKKRNDGTTYYGSHLRRAINSGARPLHIRLGGPGQWMMLLASPRTFFYYHDRPLELAPGRIGEYRHDLLEVSCPGTATHTATAPAPDPEPAPVLLSLTGARTSSTATVTVTAVDAQTGAALSGEVTINSVTGSTGQAITYNRCGETLEYEDTRGVTRTRTIRTPCQGTVKISGFPDMSFTF
jgi:hypothetical protein